jgi:hypothetical protein
MFPKPNIEDFDERIAKFKSYFTGGVFVLSQVNAADLARILIQP